ncbi:hypothetical protein IID19_04675, partial [Patescibacteria group bacterium]|nr:hypothetical protein [Patescibacteria group bacterium]
VTASGDVGTTNLQINIWEGADLERWTNSEEWPGLVFDSSDQPHIVWSDDTIAAYAVGDIHYRYWDSTNVAWVTASGNFTPGPGAHFDDPDLDVDTSPALYSKNATLALDRFGNSHVAWNETEFSSTECTSNTNCTDPSYPQCLYHHLDGADVYQCASTDISYSRWSPGTVQSGLGWTEFLPAGALLGVPFLETTQGDIFSSGGIQLAPPPRGSGAYTATYLILANGEIRGISGTYGRAQSGLPTSQLVEPGLNPLITDAGLPFGQNVFGDLDEDVEDLVTRVGASSQNRFGHTVEKDTTNTGIVDISSSGVFNNPVQPILDGKVYHFTGADSYAINQQMTFTKGNGDIASPPITTGNGLIVIDGDLEINANVLYDSTTLDVSKDTISQLPSAAIIVRGNIYVSSFVDEISGVFVAIDNPLTTEIEGTINTSRKAPVVNTVSASENDAFVSQSVVTFTKNLDGTTLRFGYESSTDTTYRTFLRWPITIPEGSEIRKAYLQLQGDGNSTSNDFTARISLIDFDSANVFDFSDTNFPPPDSSLYSAPTSVSVNYDTTGWTNGAYNNSIDISKLVQRFIDHDQYADAGSNNLGLMIQQGNAASAGGGADTFKQLHACGSVTCDTSKTPQLVIEYSPRRTVYETTGSTDDVISWGTIDSGTWCQIGSGAQCDVDPPCMNIGWDWKKDLSIGHNDFEKDLPNRIYYRLDTKPGNSDIPPNAEITNSELKLLADSCNEGSANLSFQLRQGLLDQADMPVFSANPYNEILNPAVSEVAEDISDGAWVDDGTVYTLADSSRLIQAWVDMSGYLAGNEVGLRLRRNGSAESIAGPGESRPIKSGATELEIDFLAPLKVSGLFIARGYNFDRKYSKDLAPAEQIVYDGRVVANTPPGLTDFTKALPIFQRVTP